MKAVILAAGEGRRLEPLTEVRPKPMLPVANKPLLEYVVEAAAEAGVDEIVLVVGYKRERIQSHFGDGDDWDVDIDYAVQSKQLGTGHAILQAESRVDGPFLVLNGDRILEPAIIERVLDWEPTDDALLAVTHSNQPSDYGVVEVAGERVQAITEKPPRFATATDIINAGVYRFGDDVFDVLRKTETDGELTVTAALQGLVDDDRVRAIPYDGFWLDVSYLWDYLEVNAEVLDRFGAAVSPTADVHPSCVLADDVAVGADTAIQPNASVLPGTSLGDNVLVEPNAVIANSVVLSDATVEAGAVLRDCIVGENATIGPGSTVEGGPAAVAVERALHEDVRLGGVVGDNASFGGNVTVVPGTVVGTGAVVDGGSVLRGRVPSGAEVRRG